MGYRDYSTAKGLIVDATGHGDFTSIQDAINAASSGQTVFIRNGVYTENITAKPGVIISSFPGSANFGGVQVLGKWTFTLAGTYLINEILLQTNSDFCISVTGAADILLELDQSVVFALDNDGINFSNSSAASIISLFGSIVNAGNPHALYVMTSPGNMIFFECQGGGLSTAPSTNSDGAVAFFTSQLSTPVSCSGAALLNFSNSRIDTSFQNATSISLADTSIASLFNAEFSSGTASCVSIGAGCSSIISHCSVNSSNAHVLTGAGTLNYAFITFTGSSSGHNVMTETALPTL